MATTTERFGFTLPAGVDPVSIVVLNLNTQNIERYLGATQDMIAPMYDENEGTYSVDDVVQYDNGLYKCLEDIPVPESWDEDKWEQTYAILNGGGSGGASAIEKTQAEYDALTPAEKNNGAIYMVNGSQELDDNYSYYSAENDTIIVRVYHEGESDQKIEWFFRGWNQTSGDMTIPSELSAYKPTNPNVAIYSANYTSGGATQNGWIGFYNNNIRAWSQDTAYTITGTMYGVVDVDGGDAQTNPYVEDPYVYIEGSNKIYYMGTEYANTNGGSGGGGSEGRVLLAESDSTYYPANTEVSLSDSLSKYDYLIFDLFYQTGAPMYSSVVSVDVLKNNSSLTPLALIYTNIGNSYVQYVDDTTISVPELQNFGFKRVYGVKSSSGGGGGTDVEANPQGEPTDTLSTIRIGEDIYDIEGSGGSDGEGVEIYSESEYIVGKWIDGKKLYQRTYYFPSPITVVGNGTWTSTGIDISDIERLIDSSFSQDVAVWDTINGINDNGTLKATILANGSLTVDTITIRYTKTVETDAPAWGGSVNNYGGFIDTNNLIYTTVSSTGTDSYTATEDCYVMLDVVNGGGQVSTVQIDGETVSEYFLQGSTALVPYNGYLKKGQTITVTHGQTASHTINVYGVSYSSSSSGGSSTAEDVSYDNTDSGLVADNVQDAIDEVVDSVETVQDDVSELSSNLSNLIKTVDITVPMTTTQYDGYYIATFRANLTNAKVINAFVRGADGNHLAFVGYVDDTGLGRVNCVVGTGNVYVRVVYI